MRKLSTRGLLTLHALYLLLIGIGTIGVIEVIQEHQTKVYQLEMTVADLEAENSHLETTITLLRSKNQ